MKLIVSTFLVYKVKKCLLKSGKVILKSQRNALTEYAQALGTRCPSRGDMMPNRWGDNAQAVGNTYDYSFLYLVE